MKNNHCLEDELRSTSESTTVKIVFESGCYCCGRKDKLLRELPDRMKNAIVIKIFDEMIPVAFHRNLARQKIIYCK